VCKNWFQIGLFSDKGIV